MTHEGHELKDIDFAVITVSDTRKKENDISGKRAIELIEAAGYSVAMYDIVRDDSMELPAVFSHALEKADVVFFTGGTGVTSRDITIETIRPMLRRQIPGFGELFRYRSFKQIGARAMLSSACAGTVSRGNSETAVVFCVPGSPGAVETALKDIILPAVGHILWEARR